VTHLRQINAEFFSRMDKHALLISLERASQRLIERPESDYWPQTGLPIRYTQVSSLRGDDE
jgi:hypothetical protein